MEHYIKDNLILDTLIDSVYDAICVIDNSCIVQLWNASAERLYGISKRDILGKDLRSFFTNALLPQVLSNEQTFINHFHSPTPDKRMVITAKPVYMKGVRIGAISADRDVSELTKLNKAHLKLSSNLDKLKEEIEQIYEDKFSFSEIIGASEPMLEVIEMAKSVAASTLSVLITGESGTGKELFARALHTGSGRKGLFVPINCSAIPKTLLESELFGYAEGAFTGAIKGGKPGLFETADGGTLFLDEIGDMPLGMQAKLLRVLEDGRVQRIGSSEWVATDVRIIAATHRDLRTYMANKQFRNDLFYRLNAVHIKLPSLRQRPGDIELLVKAFTQKYCHDRGIPLVTYDADAMACLKAYTWEGNVRELKNMVERFVIMSVTRHLTEITPDLLPEEVLTHTQETSHTLSLTQAVDQFEKHMIERVLLLCKGNRQQCAQKLGIPRSTLYFKLDKYHIG